MVAARHRRQSQHLMCVSICIGNGIFILYLYQILGDFHTSSVANCKLQYFMTTAMTIDDVNDRIGCRMMLVMNMMMIMMRLMKAR